MTLAYTVERLMMIVTDHFDQTSSVINLINRKPIMATLSVLCSLGFFLTYIMAKKELVLL